MIALLVIGKTFKKEMTILLINPWLNLRKFLFAVEAVPDIHMPTYIILFLRL